MVQPTEPTEKNETDKGLARRVSLVPFAVIFNVLPFVVGFVFVTVARYVAGDLGVPTWGLWVVFLAALGGSWWSLPRLFPVVCPNCNERALISTGIARFVAFKCSRCDYRIDRTNIAQYR